MQTFGVFEVNVRGVEPALDSFNNGCDALETTTPISVPATVTAPAQVALRAVFSFAQVIDRCTGSAAANRSSPACVAVTLQVEVDVPAIGETKFNTVDVSTRSIEQTLGVEVVYERARPDEADPDNTVPAPP